MTILFNQQALNYNKELKERIKNGMEYPIIPIILFSVLFTLLAGVLSYLIASLATVGLSAIAVRAFNFLEMTTVENLLGGATVVNVILLIVSFIITVRFVPQFVLKVVLKNLDKFNLKVN